MSASEDTVGAILGLLANSLSTTSAVQKQAEKTLRQQIDLCPEIMVGALIHLLSQESTPSEARSLCAVLLRRNLPVGEPMILNKLSLPLQAELKSSLLRTVAAESSPNIRKLLCDTIAVVAQITLYRGQWDEIIPALEQMSLQPSETMRESALIILGKIGDALPEVQRDNIGALVALFTRGLSDSSFAVRTAALTAVSSTFIHVDENQIAHFNNLRLPVLHVVRDSLLTDDDSDFASIVQMLLHVSNNAAIDDEVLQLCLELATTIIEGAPNASRKCPALLEASISLALSLMIAFDEEHDTWQHASKNWEASEDAGFGAGETAIDRISRSVGGKKMTPVIVNLVSKGLSDTKSWKSRFAALMALTQASEVMSLKKLPEMVSLVLRYTSSDESPYVQYAAINCMGQMCTDFGPDIQNDYHAEILPALLVAMEDSRHPRVQSHAAAAIINFSEHCKGNILQAYADTLVSRLYSMLQRPQRIIQEQAMTAIASVAECISTSFAKFYEHFVPLLKFAILNANGPDDAMFRGRALECITFIGMAVGNERFAPDAKDVMELTIKIVQAGAFASDDPSYSYMVQAWTRICSALGPSFSAYGHVVIPTVLRSAQIKCVLGRVDEDDDDGKGEKQIFEIGDEQYGISTNQIEEKSLGCSALGSFVATLNKDFFPWLRPTVETFLPLLKFHFEENVQQSCAGALPDLLLCAVTAQEANMCEINVPQELALITITSLLDALQEEEDVFVMSSFLHAIQSCFDKCGERSAAMFPIDIVKAVRDQVIKMVEHCEGRRRSAAVRTAEEEELDDEDDDDKRIETREAEEQLQYMLAECFGSMIKQLKKHFLPIFHETLPAFMQMLDPSSGLIPRKIAIFIFDDFVEAMQLDAGPYLSSLLPLIGRYLSDPDPDIRQAVAFGFAVCAQHAGQHFVPYVSASAQSLISMIQHPISRQSGNKRATDNAVAALGRILRYQSDHVDCAQLLPMWLGMLPIRDDAQESAICIAILCDLIESNNTHLLGKDLCNLPKIVQILVDVLHTKLSNATQAARIIPILKQLPPTIMSQIVAELPLHLKEKVANLN